MHLQVYYLHSCARTSASWLKDSHILPNLTSSLRLLCTAAQYIGCEDDDLLPGPYDVREPHVQWAMCSGFNYVWVLGYYETLSDLAIKHLNHKPNDWAIKRKLYSYAGLFPREPFTPPPFLFGLEYLCTTTEETYRNYYRKEEAKGGVYRRVAVPFWLKIGRGPTISPQIHDYTPTEAYDLSDDPLADLR